MGIDLGVSQYSKARNRGLHLGAPRKQIGHGRYSACLGVFRQASTAVIGLCLLFKKRVFLNPLRARESMCGCLCLDSFCFASSNSLSFDCLLSEFRRE